MTWNDGNPKVGNQVAADIPDIQENIDHVYTFCTDCNLTDHSILLGSGTGPITPLTVGTTGQILAGVSTSDPAWAANILYASNILYLGDTANTKMTQGLTINQGANDDEVFAVKSSDVGHAGTDIAETDTFFKIAKVEATAGGASLEGMKDADGGANSAMVISGYLAENVDTTKTTSGRGLVEVFGSQLSGAALADVVDEGNVLAVICRAGSTIKTLMVVDENGEVNAIATPVNAFDAFDDAQLVRAYDLNTAEVIESRWDEFIQYNQKSLEDAGILGKVLKKDRAKGVRPLYSINKLQKLHNGAIWQGRLIDTAIVNTMDKLMPGFRAELTSQLNDAEIGHINLLS